MGPTGRHTVARLMAFLLLCIGVQIMVNGVDDVMARGTGVGCRDPSPNPSTWGPKPSGGG